MTFFYLLHSQMSWSFVLQVCCFPRGVFKLHLLAFYFVPKSHLIFLKRYFSYALSGISIIGLHLDACCIIVCNKTALDFYPSIFYLQPNVLGLLFLSLLLFGYIVLYWLLLYCFWPKIFNLLLFRLLLFGLLLFSLSIFCFPIFSH